MADTIRSLAELNALLADNSSGAISAQDIRDLMISLMVHGAIGASLKSPITLGSVWETVDLDTDQGISRGLTIDTTNKRIADVPVDMKVVAACEVVFIGDSAEEYEFGVSVNAAAPLGRSLRTVTSDGGKQWLAWQFPVSLSGGDYLNLVVRSDGNGFELERGLLRIQRIGVE